jgi:hypothetical protein
MKRILVIGSFLTLMSGCSLIGMQPVQKPLLPQTYPQCSESMLPVTTDLFLSVVLGLITVNQIQSNVDKANVFVFGLPSAALLGSSIYGSVLRRRCAAVRRKAEEVIHPPYLPAPTEEEPAPSPPESSN